MLGEIIGGIIVLAIVGWFVVESNKVLEEKEKQRQKDEDAT